ncbi:MAG: (d)CMP kinase [Actinomycetota bacterium]
MTAIAIDGPAGAGKSTVAAEVARRLGFRYVDTGAMYRAIALAALDAGVDGGPQLVALARGLRLSTVGERIVLDGTDVTDRIRAPDVTAMVSRVAADPEVRGALLELQRDAARREDVVMEGRDIGSAVLPDADVKVFLTATLEERARRRSLQGGEAEGDVIEAIRARDEADASRATSPLVQAENAVVIDSTGRSIEEVVDEIVALAEGLAHRSQRPGGTPRDD